MQSAVITLKIKPTKNKLLHMVFSMQLQNSIALNQINLMYVSFRIGDNKINNILPIFVPNLSDTKHKLQGFYAEIAAYYGPVWD